jgi:hypothetical protein
MLSNVLKFGGTFGEGIRIFAHVARPLLAVL